MSPGHDEGRPAQSDQSSSNNLTLHDTPEQWAKHGLVHVVGAATRVTSASGISRFVIVWRCTLCGSKHLSHGRHPLPETLERRGPHGRVVLHIVSEQVAAA